jgi:hypothetical protein
MSTEKLARMIATRYTHKLAALYARALDMKKSKQLRLKAK